MVLILNVVKSGDFPWKRVSVCLCECVFMHICLHRHIYIPLLKLYELRSETLSFKDNQTVTLALFMVILSHSLQVSLLEFVIII